ncbi:MAG TPA: NADP-dependent oxidoreductase [Bacteroidales bacterium]|nr:NADP-dependent oxidoreductase [Bacteroidales bacterium]
MKAITLSDFGGIENLVIKELPVPVIGDSEVLVRNKAISINPVDIKTRKGQSLAGALKEFMPIILGWDISGTVVETGSKVSQFKNGDDVFGLINFPGYGRAYAEYVSVPASHLAKKPEGITHEESAAASLAALTAWQVLKEKVKIKQGDKVLIHAAAGGVGHYAVQIAKYLGATVFGTASERNRDFVISLGASVHIDYEKSAFENEISDIDFVLDTIGGQYIDRSLKVLRPGGTIVCIPSAASQGIEEKAAAMGLTGSKFLVQSDGNNMKEIALLLSEGHLKSYISKIYSFDQVQEAHLQIETAKTKGKIVLSI